MFATTLRCNRVTVNPALAKATEPTQADYAAFQAQVGSYGQRVRTRMQELHDQGLLVTVAAAGDIDYSGLANAGLGNSTWYDGQMPLYPVFLICRIRMLFILFVMEFKTGS